MMGMIRQTQQWWFGIALGLTLLAATLLTAVTTGVSVEAGGMEVALGIDAANGLQLTFARAG